MFRTLYFSASKTCNKSPQQVFSKIDTVHKLVRYEDEFKEFIIEEGDESSGFAKVVVEIFGKVIRGRMRYKVGDRCVYAVVDSRDIKALEFGYIVEKIDGGTRLTQFVKFDTGSILRNIFVLIFMSRRIRRHLEREVTEILE